MKRIAKGPMILLLLVPLLLGAAASDKRASSKDPAVHQEAAKATSSLPSITTSTAHQPATAPTSIGGGKGASTVSSPPSNYTITWSSMNGGGTTDAGSTNFKEGMSIGQSMAGEATSPSYRLGIGFWYGTCSCPCHGDPLCDSITNVQDVVLTVGVAFRGAAPFFDTECPRERTDVNCDAVTTVIDVVKMVDVAFRGADPSVKFCRPCAR